VARPYLFRYIVADRLSRFSGFERHLRGATMLIEVEVKSPPTKKQIDVQFPLFLKSGDDFDSGGWYETYRRIDADGRTDKITINDRGEWEYERGRIEMRELGYYLCADPADFSRDLHDRIEATAFYSKLDEFRGLLDGVPRL